MALLPSDREILCSKQYTEMLSFADRGDHLTRTHRGSGRNLDWLFLFAGVYLHMGSANVDDQYRRLLFRHSPSILVALISLPDLRPVSLCMCRGHMQP